MSRLIIFLSCALWAGAAAAQVSSTGVLFRLGTINIFDQGELDRVGPAFHLGLEHVTYPSRLGFSYVIGGGLGYDTYRRTGSGIGVFSGTTNNFVSIVRGNTYRLLEARAYGGGVWSRGNFSVRARLGISYLLAARFQGFEQISNNDGVVSFDRDLYKVGFENETTGSDGRYRVDIEDRYGLELGTDLNYRINQRVSVGVGITFRLNPIQPVGSYGEPCGGGICPELTENPFRINIFTDRHNLEFSVKYDLSTGY